MTKLGEYIREWPNVYQASKELNISDISKCCNGYRIISGGFKWKFKENEKNYKNRIEFRKSRLVSEFS